MKSKLLLFLFLITSFVAYTQESIEIEEDSSIKGQFDRIYRISTTYQTYKVIDRDEYEKLKSNVLDSLKNCKKLISEKENLLKTERDNVEVLNSSLNTTKLDLDTALQKENSIFLFGSHLNKTTYNLILWFIIILLFVGLGFFIFKFSKSNVLTNEAQSILLDIEQEFDDHRKKSIEREQKLRRQLQDEINKQRNG
ncbi:MAG: ATP-dependent Zn protease [Maribacter sp.]|jgi:ATP-dependent Zn protease